MADVVVLLQPQDLGREGMSVLGHLRARLRAAAPPSLEHTSPAAVQHKSTVGLMVWAGTPLSLLLVVRTHSTVCIFPKLSAV
jgi:hypothetical protein